MDWARYYSLQAHSGLCQPAHFTRQIGGGFYSGVRKQQGYGLGGLLAKLGRFVLPILKPVVKSIGKQAIRSGAQIAGDILDGQNPKQAFKQNLRQGTKELFQKVVKKKLKPVKRKRKSKKVISSKTKRSKKLDIFD